MDCIILGYNETDMETAISSMKLMERVSGGYRHLLSNTIEFRGRRMHYMDFLNGILEKSSGKKSDLHLMEVPNLGVCYLKSFLVSKNLIVKIVNCFNKEKERFSKLLKEGPLAVAVTTTFYADSFPIAEIVKFIRKNNVETKIIVGGPYVFNICNWNKDITTQDYILDTIGADIYIHSSQGEDTLAKVIHELGKGKKQNLGKLPNLIYKKRFEPPAAHGLNEKCLSCLNKEEITAFTRTSSRVENNIMDENAIDWSLFSHEFYTPTVQLRTARGCAFSCAFCNFPVLAGPLHHVSIEVLDREMIFLKETGVKNLVLIDDTINVPLPRFKKMLKMMIDKEFDFNWFSYFRCANSDDETFDLMLESGCRGVFLGLESGDQGILDNMNKQVKIEQYKKGIRKLNERGIITFASFLLGFPGETEKTVQNTIRFIEETCLTYYKAQIYYHSVDNPINRNAEKFGLHSSSFSWRHNTMDWKSACDMVDLMYKTIKGPTIVPSYMFGFWAIPYLFGKGVLPEHLNEFLRLAQRLLINSFHAESLTPTDEKHIYQMLFSLGRKMSIDIESTRTETD